MKLAILLLTLASSAVWAQVNLPVAANVNPAGTVAKPAAAAPSLPPQQFTGLERAFDSALETLNKADRIDILGGTRALYLADYGLVMTTDLSLVVTPGPNPFRPQGFSPAERDRMNKRKAAQLPALKKAMRDELRIAAYAVLAGAKVPLPIENSRLQVVLAVRVLYLQWEDTTGLPAQIVMRASLKDAIDGNVHEEVQ